MGKPVARRGYARGRVLAAALELFHEHGVAGTSLQMIADRLGVTKAAVYHQFPAKDEIVVGLLRQLFEALEDLLHVARDSTESDRRRVLVEGLVELMLQQRHAFAAFFRDPAIERVMVDHPEFGETITTFGELVFGPAEGQELVHLRVALAMFGSGVSSAVVDPQLADIPDEILGLELRRLGRGLFTSDFT